MRIKLNKTNIDKISLPSKVTFYRDDELTGFGIKANPTKLVYIVETKLHGKVIRKNIGLVGVLSPDEARKQAKVVLAELAKGINVNLEEKRKRTKGVTLIEVAERYKRLRPLSEKTAYDYDRAMATTFKDWQHKEVVSIDRDMIEKRFKEKTSESPSVANLHFRILRALINFAMEIYSVNGEPLVPSNPCNRLNALKLWNRIARKDTFIKPYQFKDFWEALKIKDDDIPTKKVAKQQCTILLFTGCREQEVAKLKRKDVNFAYHSLTFDITKNHHKHVLPMGYWLETFIKGLCEGLKDDDYLLPAGNKSGHIKDHRKIIQEISQESGIDFTLHDLRRTFTTIVDHYLTKSFSKYVIKRLLNHSQNDDVTAGYVSFDIEPLREPMQMVEDFILAQAGVTPFVADNVVRFEDLQKNLFTIK